MKDEHENTNIQHCNCCSTGDYSELFSEEKTEKRTDLRFAIFYFFLLILTTLLGLYMAIVSVVFCVGLTVYYYYKKEKNYSIRSIIGIIFALIPLIFF